MTAITAAEATQFDALIAFEAELTTAHALRDLGADAATRERGAADAERINRAFDAAWMALSNPAIDRFFSYRKGVMA